MGTEAQTLATNVVTMAVLVAFVALGYSLLYGVLRVINFAHTDVIAVSGYACILTTRFFGRDLLLVEAFPICFVAGAFFGLVCAAAVYLPFGRKAPLESLLASFCVSLAIRATLSLSFSSATRVMPISLGDNGLDTQRIDLVFAIVAISITAIFGYVLTRTLYGLALRGSGSDAEQVAFIGYPVGAVSYGAFAIAGAFGGLAAIPIGVANGVAPDVGTMYGLWAFAATVFGGLGRIRGTLIAGLILGASLTLAARFFQPLLVNSVVFAGMAMVLALRPQGLAGLVTRKV